MRPVEVASHPRSGTHLLIDTLRLNFESFRSWKWWGERNDRLYLNLDHVIGGSSLTTPGKVQSILHRCARPIIKTHAWPGYEKILLQSVAESMPMQFIDWLDHTSSRLYVYRDGRDVMRSLHELMQEFDPETRVPLGEFIRQKSFGVSRARAWADHVRQWAYRDDVYCVKMEELIAQPALIVGQIADHLGESVTQSVHLPKQSRSKLHGPLQRLTRTRPQSTAIMPKHPPATSASWRQQFSGDDRRFFQDETENLLVTLMYEQSADWVDR